jgi:hypothetical protein
VNAGEEVLLPGCTVSGGSGACAVKIYVSDGKTEWEVNGSFRPSTVADHTVRYVATDYIGLTGEYTATIKVNKGTAPIFVDKPELPKYMIAGAYYYLPELYADDYTSGELVRRLATISVTDANGTKTVAAGEQYVPAVANNLDNIAITYEVDGVTYSAEIPTVKAKDDDGVYVGNYFDLKGATLALNDETGLISATASNGSWTFANALVANEVVIGFKADTTKSEFDGIKITFTDSKDESVAISASLYKKGSNSNFVTDVKEFDIEEAEAVKIVSANRRTTPISRQKKMTFGAIRWDAYMETGKETSFVSDQVARALSPRQYHSMAPFFAKVTDMDKIEFGVADQEQFDKEALLAIKAGIDYFAYCWYRDDDPMSYARKQHLTSQHRDKIKMCTIVSANSLDEKSLKSLGKLMMEDCYLKFDNRPVVYVYDGFKVTYESLCRIEASAKEAGISEPPYFIGMAEAPTPSILNEFVSKGIDAIGAYSCGVQKANEEYDVLASIAEEHNGQKYTYNEKIDIVPLVICGRDTRPRIENPVSWAGNYAGRYAKTPTGEQLYNHACRVFDRMLKEKDKNIPNTVLAYAWNEHDEGGWCCPTLAADSDGQPIIDENGSALMNCTMLNALQRALKEFREKENME